MWIFGGGIGCMSSMWPAVYCLVLPIEPVCGNFVASRLLVAQWTVARVCEMGVVYWG